MLKHSFHIKIAEVIDKIITKNAFSLNVLKDGACGGKNYLSFFLSDDPSRASQISQVDLIILKNNKIKLICEIEESGFNPTKIFGKIFVTASAKVFRMNNDNAHKYYEFDENVIFLQIIDNKSFKNSSKKEMQGHLIENEINNKLIFYNSFIKKYRLLYGNEINLSQKNSEKIIDVNFYEDIESIITNIIITWNSRKTNKIHIKIDDK